MKRYLTITSIVLSVILGLQVNANNKGQLKGKLIDSDTKEGIHCANVMIVIDDELISGTVSGVKGDYLIESITPGTYSVKASFVGYKTVKVDSVVIQKDRVTELDIEIEKSNVFLEGVEVKTDKIPLISYDCTHRGGRAFGQGSSFFSVPIYYKPENKTFGGSEKNTLFEEFKKSGGKEVTIASSKMPNSTSQFLAIPHSPMFSSFKDCPEINSKQDELPVFYIDGMRVTGIAAYVPECAVQQVSVYHGGTPAEYENDVIIDERYKNFDLPDKGIVSSYFFTPPSPRNTYNTCDVEAPTEIIENEFVSPFDTPMSTFSIDVDKAAYRDMRFMLNKGYVPHRDVIRLEELINFFSYSYESPKEAPFSVYSELAACPWNTQSKLLHIGIQGENVIHGTDMQNNLIFLLDVSCCKNSSKKLSLLKESVKLLVSQLDDKDKVAIVVYSGSCVLELPSTSCDQKELIFKKVDELYASWYSVDGAGIELAYKVAVDNFIEGGNNRVILATDGDFNVGINDNEELLKMIDKRKESGVFLSVLGIGSGNYKNDQIEILADHGNGNYAFIDCVKKAHKVLVSDLSRSSSTIAKDVKLQIEFNPSIVKSYRLVGYENRLLEDFDFEHDNEEIEEIEEGHSITAIYEVQFAEDNQFQRQQLRNHRRGKSGIIDSDELAFMKIRYKNPVDSVSQLLQFPIANTVVNEPSENFGFSASVAGFGLLLRGSEFIDDAFDYEQVLEMAKKYKGDDEEGYRSEFIQLVKLAEEIDLANNQ
jgi:Ca-activated chloride channel family protein